MWIKRWTAVGLVILGIACCEGEVVAPPEVSPPFAHATVEGQAMDFIVVDLPGMPRQEIPVQRLRTQVTVVVDSEDALQGIRAVLDRQETGAYERPSRIPRPTARRLEFSASASEGVLDSLRSQPGVRYVDYALDAPGGVVELTGEILVQTSRSGRDLQGLLDDYDLTAVRGPDPGMGWTYWVLALPHDRDALALAATLQDDPRVEWADLDRTVDAQPATADPLFSYQYYLTTGYTMNGVPVHTNAVSVWDSTTGSGTTVAVFDTGVQRSHPDLGTVDLRGWDTFKSGGPGWDVPGCTDCATSPYMSSVDAHGTEVAGIIQGQHNSIGVAGMAPGVNILPIRIFRNGTSTTNGYIADAVGVAWASSQVDILSNSWGVPPGAPASTAVGNQYYQATAYGRGGKGAVVVFAAGNDYRTDGLQHYAEMPFVLAVGAIEKTGAHAAYSNQDPTGSLDLVAPSSPPATMGGFCGGDLVTVDLAGSYGCNGAPVGGNDYTGKFGGTSAAVPQVSAAAALLLSVEPTLTELEVRERLTAFADAWGPTMTYGQGKLNVFNAIFPPPPPTVSISGPSEVPPSESCMWWAIASSPGSISYTWQKNGQWIWGAWTSDLLLEDTGTSDFELKVIVTDEWHQVSTDVIQVDVDSHARQCFF